MSAPQLYLDISKDDARGKPKKKKKFVLRFTCIPVQNHRRHIIIASGVVADDVLGSATSLEYSWVRVGDE